MRTSLEHYINGKWVKSRTSPHIFETINPANETVSGKIILGDENDVDDAVKAAKNAFKTWSKTTRTERLVLLEKIHAGLQARQTELAQAITDEMGAPKTLSFESQAVIPIVQAKITHDILRDFSFEKLNGSTMVRLTPIGVCGLITPWNWPGAVVMAKVFPALATGNTAVFKPSEYAPFSARIITEIIHDAGVPAGVFNMVYGDGNTVGEAISGHPDIDMISFTGSTRAGIAIAKNAANTVKRVHQELGGKSPNIILPSADFPSAVARGLKGLMVNSGQTCCAPSRMLVPKSRLEEVKSIIKEHIVFLQPGNPADNDTFMGPVVNKVQYERIQALIKIGIESGATVVTGGTGRPAGLEKGYYVKPTVFADTTPDMAIVRQEIFGPVLVIQAYDTIEEAIKLANDTDYGLAAYIQGADSAEMISIADQIPAGQIYLNEAGDTSDFAAPFGGYKQSGNGREGGEYGFEAFLEMKALLGFKSR